MESEMSATVAAFRRECLSATALAGILFLLAPSLLRAAEQAKPRQVPVDSLIFDLKNPDPVRRKEAAIALGVNKVQRAVPDLVAAAPDKDPAVRREIVVALDKMADAAAQPAFVSLLGDPEKDIRDKCISGLINLYVSREGGLVVTLNRVANFFNPWSDEWGEVVVEPGITPDPTVVKGLSERLQDGDEGIRQKAARALGILKGREAIPALLHSVTEERSNNVRFDAIRALRKIGDASVAPELMNYVGYQDKKVREEAVYGVGYLRHRGAVPELTRLYQRESSQPLKEVDKAYREQLLGSLALIADPSSRELFQKEKGSPEDPIRLSAIEGLARVGDASMVTELSRDKIREKEPRVRVALAFTLYRLGRPEHLEEVVMALGSRKTNEGARRYLLELRPDEIPDLIPYARRNDADIREALAEILGLRGDARVVPVLQELSKDTRGQVAALANQALRRLNSRQAM
jgi:HEAT repeat protein